MTYIKMKQVEKLHPAAQVVAVAVGLPIAAFFAVVAAVVSLICLAVVGIVGIAVGVGYGIWMMCGKVRKWLW